MKLADILTKGLTSSSALLAPTKRVEFRVMGHTKQGERTFLDASAILVFLDDQEREAALREAGKVARLRNGGADPSHGEMVEERTYQLLALALRDEDNTAAVFTRDATTLRKALHALEATRVWETYEAFLAEEYPSELDEETWKRLVDDAEKKYLRDLLLQYGSSAIRRVVPFLAGRCGAPLTVTSGAGAPTSPPPSG